MKLFLLLLFWLLWFFYFSSRAILGPLLPLFENDLGISHTLAGSLSFYVSAGYTLSLLMAGPLSTRLGPKKTIAVAAAVLLLSYFMLRFADSYRTLAAMSFAMGIGSGLYLPSAVPLLTHVFRPENWGKAFAVHESAPTFTLFFIPLMMALSLRFFSWKDFLLLFAGACLVATCLFMIYAPSVPLPPGKRKKSTRLIRRRAFWIMMVIWGAASASVMAIFTIMPLVLVSERGMSAESANTILGISRVGAFLITFVIGFLVDRFGPRKMIILALSLAGLTTVWVALPQPLWLLLVALNLQAIFSMAYFPIGMVVISKLTTPQERSHFTGGVLGFGVTFGGGIAPLALGAAGDYGSFQAGILGLGFFVLLSCLLFIPLHELKN